MGALAFYTFIYFVGHFAALGLNIITNKNYSDIAGLVWLV